LDAARQWRCDDNGSELAMSRYSDEDKARVRRESYEAIRRVDEMLTGAASDDPPVDDDAGQKRTTGFAFEPPFESRIDRERRELAEQERRFEIERAREAREERREAAKREPGSLLLATNQRIGAVEDSMLELARGTNKLAEAVNAELIELRTENAKLIAQLSRLETDLAKLKKEVRAEPPVIDLPPLPMRTVQ
jgi:hypothetical protein